MKFESKKILYAAFFPIMFLIILWIFFAIQWSFDWDWYRLGILPRNIDGLFGIITSPFIHSDIKHLFSNSIPLLVLGWCLFYFYNDLGYVVFPIIWILSGIFTWFIGRESWHIGASGLVYGLSFFLFFSGIFRKYVPLLAISMLVVFLYGSTVWNMLPVSEWIDDSVSWEGHLAGAVAGLLCAVLFRKKGPQQPETFPEEDETDDTINETESDTNETIIR